MEEKIDFLNIFFALVSETYFYESAVSLLDLFPLGISPKVGLLAVSSILVGFNTLG